MFNIITSLAGLFAIGYIVYMLKNKNNIKHNAAVDNINNINNTGDVNKNIVAPIPTPILETTDSGSIEYSK